MLNQWTIYTQLPKHPQPKPNPQNQQISYKYNVTTNLFLITESFFLSSFKKIN